MRTSCFLLAAVFAVGISGGAAASPVLNPGELSLDVTGLTYLKGPKGHKAGKFKAGKSYGYMGRATPPGWSRGRKVGWYKQRGYYAPYRSRAYYRY